MVCLLVQLERPNPRRVTVVFSLSDRMEVDLPHEHFTMIRPPDQEPSGIDRTSVNMFVFRALSEVVRPQFDHENLEVLLRLRRRVGCGSIRDSLTLVCQKLLFSCPPSDLVIVIFNHLSILDSGQNLIFVNDLLIFLPRLLKLRCWVEYQIRSCDILRVILLNSILRERADIINIDGTVIRASDKKLVKLQVFLGYPVIYEHLILKLSLTL